MVRKGEIACRDGWSRDLWAPRTDAGAPDGEQEETRQRPLPPISPEEMSVLVDNGQVDLNASARPATPVDVVVGEAPAMPFLDERATLLSHDPRAAIEAARKRHSARTAGSEPESAAQSGALEGPAAEKDEQPEGERSPSGSTIVWRPNPLRTPKSTAESAPSEAARGGSDHFSTVPDRVDGVDLPRVASPKVAPAVAGEAQELPDDPRRQSLQRLRERQSRLGITPIAPRMTPPSQEPPLDEADEDVPRFAEPKRSWRGFRGRDTRVDPALADPSEHEWHDAAAAEHDLEVEEPALGRELGAPEFDAEYVEYDVDAPGPDDDLAYALAGQYEDDLDIGDTAVHVAPDVPRMCRTCRDFRPADSGERGWCNNNWAFSHRRMVDAGELPCESSLGCWWLPHDDVWLSTADAGSHGEPTPLVDQWLLRRDAPRRRQGS